MLFPVGTTTSPGTSLLLVFTFLVGLLEEGRGGKVMKLYIRYRKEKKRTGGARGRKNGTGLVY